MGNAAKIKRSAGGWCWLYRFKFTIVDPDGWDRSARGWKRSWGAEISEGEFVRRALASTLEPGEDWDKFVRPTVWKRPEPRH